MEKQATLDFSRNINNSIPSFDGKTYDHQIDHSRLRKQLKDVFDFMKDGKWWTLGEISQLTGHKEQSVSARLRDLRKSKFGSHIVNRKRRGHWSDGVFEYQVIERK